MQLYLNLSAVWDDLYILVGSVYYPFVSSVFLRQLSTLQLQTDIQQQNAPQQQMMHL